MKLKKGLTIKKVLGKYLLIMFLTMHCGLSAQTGNEVIVEGLVTGKDGLPIPGASILLEKSGKQSGAVTDFDGKYSIKANVGDTLTFTYLGMTSQIVKVTGKTLNVILEEEIDELEQVIVIGYGSVKKKELTGAVARVEAKDIENIVTADLGNALQGQVSGVNVVSSSEPGASSEILIRGITSLGGSNTPLYVVDGIPQNDDPGISPNEIETIDILKDAASTAIYGARGAAGVILITTKRGEKGSLRVRLTGSTSYETLGDGQPLLNSLDQTYLNIITARNLSGTFDDQIQIAPLSNSPDRFQEDTDLSRLLFIDDASTQNYNVNVSGGGDDLKYSFVAGFYDQKGVIFRTGFERFNTRANANYTKNKLSVDIGMGMTKIYRNRGAANTINQLIRYQPTQGVLDVSEEDIDLFGGNDFNTNVSILTSLSQLDEERSTRAFTNVSVNYEIIKGLNLSTRVGINDFNQTRKRFRPVQRTFDVGRNLVVEQPSFIENRVLRQAAVTWESILNYETTFAEDHNLTLTGVVTNERYDDEQIRVNKTRVLNNGVQVLNGAVGDLSALSGPDATHRVFGLLGRIQYNYKGRYLISSSVRRDGSSHFAKQNRFGIFPSISAAWNISDEPFWESMKKTVNNFKLRIGNGTVGNENIPDYAFASPIYTDLGYGFGDGVFTSGLTQTGIGNTDVKWESSTQRNIGIDLGLFKNKVTISAEYYETDKSDMLFPITLSPSNGLDDSSSGGGAPNSIRPLNGNNRVILNIGNMVNKGFELAVGYRGNIKGKLRFRMNATFSTNENEVTNISQGLEGPILLPDNGIIPAGASALTQITTLTKGYEAGAFFVFTTDGIADTPEKLAEYQLLDPTARLGDLIYKDNDGDGTVRSAGDRAYAGSGLPKYEIGYNLNLNYKNFDLSVNTYAALGHEIVNGARATALGFGRGQELLNSFSEVNPTGTLPAYRGIFSAHPNYQPNTDLFIEDGSYFRIRNITLGYSLPKKIISSLGINRFRIFLTGQNLFTFTDYTGFNPEVGGNINSKGLDKGNYPLTKRYMVGLNFNF